MSGGSCIWLVDTGCFHFGLGFDSLSPLFLGHYGHCVLNFYTFNCYSSVGKKQFSALPEGALIKSGKMKSEGRDPGKGRLCWFGRRWNKLAALPSNLSLLFCGVDKTPLKGHI